jgi:cystathionine gamma-synthase
LVAVKKVYYPKYSDTRPNYDKCRTPNGGYGGLLSATFHTKQDAANFFDSLDTVKGPSLGTNFTLRYNSPSTSPTPRLG